MPNCNFRPYRFRAGKRYGIEGRFRRLLGWDNGFATLVGCECPCPEERFDPSPRVACYWILSKSTFTNIGFTQFPDAQHYASAFINSDPNQPTGNHLSLLCSSQTILTGYTFTEYGIDAVVYPAGHPDALTIINNLATSGAYYVPISQQVPSCCSVPVLPRGRNP